VSVSLVLTAIGDDRPGLVESLSQAVADHGGSWQESYMAHLAGKFAGILRAEVPTDRAASLEAALRQLASTGLQVVVEASRHQAAGEARSLLLELIGLDHPGIVRDISHALASRGINVDELTTELTNAPMSGEPLFKARVQLRLPADASIDDLRDTLEALANDLMVDITLDDSEPA
jgi:glycine cleavage system regulatory protein